MSKSSQLFGGGDVAEGEKVSLATGVHMLLIICQNSNHYAVMKIVPEEHIVLVWDMAAKLKLEIEKSWKVHAICALKMHVPEIVQEDELNILTKTEQMAIKDQNKGELTPFVKENFETITVHGIVPLGGGYHQPDDYSCGAIAINHFTSLLKEIDASSKDSVQQECNDGVLLEKIKIPNELKDNNSCNAVLK